MNNECTKCNGNPCGKKSKAFPSAVIEIDNPPVITNIRRVVIPASMGDDTTVPPVVGKYHNVLLYYEASENAYLYSSDGIPTKLTFNPVEIINRLESLEERISALELMER